MHATSLLAVALALAACGDPPAAAPSRALPPAEAASLLVDRNWIDRMPEAPKDRLHVVRFVPSMGGGVFQDRTVYRGEFELFTYRVDGGELEIMRPDVRTSTRTRYRVERVDGPAPFDLRLTLDAAPRGPRVYYGIAAETDRTGDTLDRRLAATVR